jgi:hypothetical protein
MSMRWECLGVLVTLAMASSVHAQEIYIFAGAQQTVHGERARTPTGSVRAQSERHFVLSYEYLNEGHVTDNHRDGVSGQIWFRLLSPSRRLDFALGAGPYRYYDTTTDQSSGQTIDAHGWGGLFSAAVHWYPKSP